MVCGTLVGIGVLLLLFLLLYGMWFDVDAVMEI